MSDDTVTFITNASQLAPPPPLKREPVGNVPGLTAMDGTPARLFAQELNAYDFGEYQASLRDDNGDLTNKTYSHNNLKFLSYTIVDARGNRLWHTEKAAIEQLGRYGQSIISKLFEAAVKVNAADEGAVDRAEGNFGATLTESQNGISASSSASPILAS